jgi:23S rRNA (guanosine2251-2'-O)-methyltransferase
MSENNFWICGKHCVKSAIIQKKRTIIKVVSSKKDPLLDKLKVNYEIENKNFFIKKFKNISHQNIAAYVSRLKLEEFNKNLNFEHLKNLVILDNITDTKNIGNILRSSHLFKIDAVIVEKRSFKQDSINIAKSASGALDTVNIITASNIANVIKVLKEKNFWITSVDLNSDVTINNHKWAKKNAIILGSEQNGIRSNIINKSDFVVSIKTQQDEKVDSLNISNVAAITLFNLYNSI